MLPKIWYLPHRHLLAKLLQPLSYIFSRIALSRRIKYQRCAYRSTLPIVVVGNIAVGGTGKTPVVQSLCRFLRQHGYRPAVISRGYGGKGAVYPLALNQDTIAQVSGDEPYMIFHSLGGEVPVVISPLRSEALKYIEKHLINIDVVIADDGLQHYKMARDYEIVVVDGQRGFGNGLCLPAGPLREPLSRLDEVNAVIVNGQACLSSFPSSLPQYEMKLAPIEFINLATRQAVSVGSFANHSVHALAGIGNPSRFFATLEQLGCELLSQKSLPDHYAFSKRDFLDYSDSDVILMTEKDAVKCRDFDLQNAWYLRVCGEISPLFYQDVLVCLERFKRLR